MATDLFSKYYNNPTKSYIYTNMTCNGASADEISFDIFNSAGVISDNENVLASLGLEGVHVPLTQYTTDMRVLNPYEILYIRGTDRGASYMSKTYKLLNTEQIEYEDWMYYTGITFAIRCTDGKSLKRTYMFKACGDINSEKTFIDVCQDLFDNNSIPINISYKDGNFLFASSQLGYEFWIAHILLWQKEIDPSTGEYINNDALDKIIDDIFKDVIDKSKFGFGFDDTYLSQNGFIEDSAFTTINVYMDKLSSSNYEHIYHALTLLNGFINEFNIENYDTIFGVATYFIYEDFSKYVPAYKYKNGAMKGCVVVPTYPVYNVNDIYDYQCALQVVHIEDRVEDFLLPSQLDYYNIPLYVRVIRDVVDSFSTRSEYDTYCKWCKNFKPWILSDEIPGPEIEIQRPEDSGWTQESLPIKTLLDSIYEDEMLRDFMGLYGYCNFATKHNKWNTFGALYIRTTIDDDPSKDTRNLIPSFIIYNPNPFPVTVKYMTFS